jgi:hypothetical protein
LHTHEIKPAAKQNSYNARTETAVVIAGAALIRAMRDIRFDIYSNMVILAEARELGLRPRAINPENLHPDGGVETSA